MRIEVRLCLLLAGLLTGIVPSFADSLNVEALMQSMAQVKSFQGSFSEIKVNALLSNAVNVKGELVYKAPAYLEKRITDPYPEQQIIDGDQVLIKQSDGSTREFSLYALPQLKIVVDSLRATLAGDIKTLKSNFRLLTEGSQEAWVLRLVPVHEDLEEELREIIIRGSGSNVREFAVLQTGGNRSTMTIKASG